jgi:hypothetical protein
MLTQNSLVLLFLAGANAQTCRDFVVNARLDDAVVPRDFAVTIEDFESGDKQWQTGPFNETLNITTIVESTCLDAEKCWKATVFGAKSKKVDRKR